MEESQREGDTCAMAFIYKGRIERERHEWSFVWVFCREKERKRERKGGAQALLAVSKDEGKIKMS